METLIKTLLEIGARHSNAITALSTLTIALFSTITLVLTVVLFISSSAHEREVKKLEKSVNRTS